jgi:hypothetical protein
MSPRVYNRRHDDVPPDAVYVGRPGKWGNPYVVGQDDTREQVIEMYRSYLTASGLINDISELAGKDLTCWCAPWPCHGDVLLEEAARAVAATFAERRAGKRQLDQEQQEGQQHE